MNLKGLRLVDSIKCQKLTKFKNSHKVLKIENTIELKYVFKDYKKRLFRIILNHKEKGKQSPTLFKKKNNKLYNKGN